MSTEDQRKERLLGFAWFGCFLRDLEMAISLTLDRGPNRIAPGEELVQAKSEDWEATRFTAPKLRSVP